MPNLIKYSTSPETLALKKGNFWIGTGDVGKGTTEDTGYWNGITPPPSGYTIYINKATQGPSIRVANNDNELIIITNQIAGTSFTSATQCLNYFATQNDRMVFNIDYPPIVTDGLVLNLDAGFTPSYSKSGTTWYDLGPSGNNGTLINGPTFSRDNGGSIVFDGANDYINLGNPSSLNITDVTLFAWVKTTTLTNQIVIGKSYISSYYLNIAPNVQKFSFWTSSSSLDSNVIPTIGNGQWCNISGTITGINKAIYFNGTLAKSGTGNAVSVDSNPVYVGNSPVINAYFNGNIALTQIYNRALSAQEILQNYNATKSRFGL